MSIVILVSGGLDSTLVAKLAHEEGIELFPLFIIMASEHTNES
jgi:7-cyano-7-deazaguanine synthase